MFTNHDKWVRRGKPVTIKGRVIVDGVLERKGSKIAKETSGMLARRIAAAKIDFKEQESEEEKVEMMESLPEVMEEDEAAAEEDEETEQEEATAGEAAPAPAAAEEAMTPAAPEAEAAAVIEGETDDEGAGQESSIR